MKFLTVYIPVLNSLIDISVAIWACQISLSRGLIRPETDLSSVRCPLGVKSESMYSDSGDLEYT